MTNVDDYIDRAGDVTCATLFFLLLCAGSSHMIPFVKPRGFSQLNLQQGEWLFG